MGIGRSEVYAQNLESFLPEMPEVSKKKFDKYFNEFRSDVTKTQA